MNVNIIDEGESHCVGIYSEFTGMDNEVHPRRKFGQIGTYSSCHLYDPV